MAKYKQLFLVADTFLPWETVGGRAGNREIEACQLNSWHRNWVKVCRHCLKPNCGRYSKELEYTVSFNVFYERDIWLSGWYGVSFLDKFNFLTFNGGLLMSFLLFERRSLLMYDVNLAPDNIKNMFTKLSSLHSYRTRSVTNENYYVEQVRTENMKRAFSISGALIWNSISLSIKTLLKKSIQKGTRENSLKYWKKRTTVLDCISDITVQFSKS